MSTVEINSYTNATDIKFKKGDKINIKASGYISLGVFAGTTGPNGIDGYSEYSVLKELKHGCLMASTGNNEWFAVGESSSFIADKDGYLGFMVNDGDPSNNSGSFIVEYGINKSLATVPTKPPVTTPIRTQSNEQTHTQPVTEPAKTSVPPMTDEQLQNALRKYGKISAEESLEEAEKFGLSYVKRHYNLQKLPKSKPFFLQPVSSWEGYIYGIEKNKLEMTLSLQKSNSNYDKEYPLVTGMVYISQSNKKFIRFKIYGYVENNTINFFFDEIKGNTLKVNVFCKLNLKGEYLNGGIRGSSISGSWENYNGQYLKTYSSDKEKGETKCGNGSFYLSEKR